MQCFTIFLSDDSKQYAATTTAHSKKVISFIKEKKVMTTSLIRIWENTDVCAKQYRCASALYLMSVMSQCYSIIIDRGISSPGHDKEVLNGLNDVDKSYINQSPALSFCGPYPKPHGTRGSSKHFHLRFDPKLVNGVC